MDVFNIIKKAKSVSYFNP